jgi:hypothetical protein
MLPFILAYLAGLVIVFLYNWYKTGALSINDVLLTFILSFAIGLIAAFMGMKMDIGNWVVYIAYAVGAAIITWKLLDKKTV